MSRVAAAILGAVLAMTLSRDAYAQTHVSFDAQVPVAPSPVAIEGARWLIYELHLTNFSREPLGVQKLDVLDGSQNRELISFESQNLAARLATVSSAEVKDRVIDPGQRAIIYIEVPLTSGISPVSLRHRIGYANPGSNRVDHVLTGAVTVRTAPRLALGPPLRGGPWAAIYDWPWPRGHRRVFYALDGRARLPGRFAIDWVLLDDQGRQSHDDPDLVANFLGYGAEVLAVADARVAEVRDGVKESPRVSTNPAHPLEEASGNFVVLDLGDGRFAIYEHLRPNSIRVTRGERVREGQVLASLGFTGDSTGPHLHFHVAEGPSPFLAEGVPFVFERFTTARSEIRRRERPAPNAVVMFETR